MISKGFLQGFALLALLLASSQSASQEASPPAPSSSRLPLDFLYQPKSLIGTVPEGYSWSADSSKLAFLWNDEGYAFRDIWIYSPATREKRRVTHHFKDLPAEAPLRGISEVVFLPGEDERLAYVLDGKLHLLDAGQPARQVEADKGAVRQLKVSPDGRHLSFVSGHVVDANNRAMLGGVLWRRNVASGEAGGAIRVAGEDHPKVVVQNYQWSKDSRKIAFLSADNRLMPERDIYYHARGKLQNNRVARAFPGDPTTLYRVGVADVSTASTRFYERPDPAHHIWGYGLSDDGRRLFINSSDMLVKHHTIYVYDAASRARQTFYYEHDPKHLRPDWQVEWAPNDDGLIILTDRDGYLHLYHQRAANQRPRAITRGKWEISSFTVDDRNKQILFLSNKSGYPERQIFRVPVAGGEVERLSPAEPGTHDPVYSPDFRFAASQFTNDQMPPELFLLNLARPNSPTRATQSPQPDFYKQRWAKISYVEFPSHVDGAKLIGRVSLPPDYDPAKRYPLIVGPVYSDSVRNQWGDRRWNPTWGLDHHLSARGYVVLNVNIRGSWGQGRAHNQGLHHSYGNIDIEDLESGVRHLVATGYADPARVAIWGSSYGGLMTLMSLSKKPDVYAAGIAGAPATNVWHAYPSQMWVMGRPDGPDMPARYERQSPLFHTAGIRDPLMIVHGTRDPVVLYSDTIAVVERLIANEQMFELVTLPGANHGWGYDSLPQARFAFKKMVDFFDRHLKPMN